VETQWGKQCHLAGKTETVLTTFAGQC